MTIDQLKENIHNLFRKDYTSHLLENLVDKEIDKYQIDKQTPQLMKIRPNTEEEQQLELEKLYSAIRELNIRQFGEQYPHMTINEYFKLKDQIDEEVS